MEHLFLDKNLSLLAKEKGFDGKCFRYFYPEDIILQGHIIHKAGEIHETTLANGYIGYSNKEVLKQSQAEERCNIPLYQQIIDWFREKHGLYIRLTPLTYCWHYKIYKLKAINNPEDEIKAYSNFTDGYQQGLDKAIEEAFKLI